MPLSQFPEVPAFKGSTPEELIEYVQKDIFNYLTDIHSLVTGIGEDTQGQLDTLNFADTIPDVTDDLTFTGNNTFTGTSDFQGTTTFTGSSTFTGSTSGIDHAELDNIGTNAHTAIDSHIADTSRHFTEGSVDHGSIAGLGDDDHTQYFLANATRNLTGNLTFSNGLIINDVALPSTYTQTYSTADTTLSAYTADDESGAYTGIDNAQGGTPYAQLTDLNALRTAYENLRAFTEDLAQFHNSHVDDHQTQGLLQ